MGIHGGSPETMGELKDLPYYHGQIDGIKATEILKTQKAGSFILRKSQNPRHRGTFTISVIKSNVNGKTEIYHFTVLGSSGAYYAKQGITFNKIMDLLDFYKSNDYENHLDIPGIRLQHAVHRADFTSPYSYATIPQHLPAHYDGDSSEVCECGIPVKDSVLPEGWALHQTPEVPGEPRRVFYQQDQLSLTQWNLPDGLRDKLTPNQRKIIQELSC